MVLLFENILNSDTTMSLNDLDTVKKFVKTGADIDFPISLWSKNKETGEKIAVDIAQQELKFDCSFFDNKGKKLADATITPMAGTINFLIVSVSKAETITWKPCEKAKYDIRVTNQISGKVVYSKTLEFDIEKGLSQGSNK